MDKFALLLIVILTGVTAERSQITFLNNLIANINQEIPINTMLMVNHHRSRNCDLQDWNQIDIPILRFNQQAKVEVRRHFNCLAICLVCIGKDYDISLLENVAENFEGMRQERIILWVYTKLTQKLLNEISSIIEKNNFVQMMIVEVQYGEKRPPNILRLEPHPSSYFVQVENILGSRSPFHPSPLNFRGRRANVLPDLDISIQLFAWLNDTVSMPVSQIQDSEIIVFAKKYNLSLVIMGASKKDLNAIPDIYLHSELTTNGTDVKNLNPYDISSLIVVVPCSRKRAIRDVFRQLKVLPLMLWILPIYVAFVAVETGILMLTQRFRGHSHRLTCMNRLLNLRAFRAILGLPFPISRRSSLSLRQLFMAISFFGLVFSSFFSCKLSALLTKHSHHPQVNNFDELRGSDLSVIVRNPLRIYIENKFGADFFEECIPRALFMNNSEVIRHMLSLNDKYAYIMLMEKWTVLDNYQKSLKRNVLCTSKNLTIMSGIPRMYVLGKNSIYDWPLSRFLRRVRENGIIKHWISKSTYYMRQSLNITQFPSSTEKKGPIGIQDLMWLWSILGLGYALATFVFIIEVFSKRSREHQSLT